MIFAAGLGTRLKPFTDNHPKALAVVNGKTLLERNIEYLKQAGIRDFVINVHHFADQIQHFLSTNNNFGVNIQISDETDLLLETGGGLKKAAPLLDGKESFVVMNVDILTTLNLTQAIAAHREKNPLATLAISDRTSSRQFLFDGNFRLSGWQNLKTAEKKIRRPSTTLIPAAFSGIHILNPNIFTLMKQNGKFSIVDTYLDLCTEHIILGFKHDNDQLVDVGTPESVVKAEKLFK